MAAIDRVNKSQDKPSSKKKPFAWVKKLTNFGSGRDHGSERKRSPKKSNGNGLATTTGTASTYSNGEHKTDTRRRVSDHAPRVSYQADPQRGSTDAPGEAGGNRSAAPTLHTNGDASDAGQSKSATTSGNTAEVGTSIFSSSNHSARSLTTTLTTIQSTAPPGHVASNTTPNTAAQSTHHSQQPSQGSAYFSHQYPTTPIASAVPAHVTGAPTGHLPTTYRSATANNLLSDNASVMTLASSHHNRRVGDRRNSADTNASMRAIPPSSQWGGSRESLPLSTPSIGAPDQGPTGAAAGPGNVYHATSSRPSIGGVASAERQSVYSSAAMSPTATGMVSERNSLYASSRVGTAPDNASTRALVGDANSIRGPLTDGGASIREASIRGEKGADGASIRSSVLGGHGRNNSVANSIATSNILRVGDAGDGQESGAATNGEV